MPMDFVAIKTLEQMDLLTLQSRALAPRQPADGVIRLHGCRWSIREVRCRAKIGSPRVDLRKAL
jgi:hypothetical protein